MDNTKDSRSGHRDRTYDRILSHPDSLRDYEIIEAALFCVLPRTDTKPIAKALMNRFGSVGGVLNADGTDLINVKGVGKRSAAFLKLLRVLLNTIQKEEKQAENQPIQNRVRMKETVVKEFSGEKTELLRVYFLDKHSKIVGRFKYEEQLINRVDLDLSELAKSIAHCSPDRAIIAHNHPSNNVEPTATDDETTIRLYRLFELHGSKLIDHIIVSGDKTFSYLEADRFKKVLNLDF